MAVTLLDPCEQASHSLNFIHLLRCRRCSHTGRNKERRPINGEWMPGKDGAVHVHRGTFPFWGSGRTMRCISCGEVIAKPLGKIHRATCNSTGIRYNVWPSLPLAVAVALHAGVRRHGDLVHAPPNTEHVERSGSTSSMTDGCSDMFVYLVPGILLVSKESTEMSDCTASSQAACRCHPVDTNQLSP